MFRLGMILQHRQTKRLIIVVSYNLVGHYVVRNVSDKTKWLLNKEFLHLYKEFEVPDNIKPDYPLDKLAQYLNGSDIYLRGTLSYKNLELEDIWEKLRNNLLRIA